MKFLLVVTVVVICIYLSSTVQTAPVQVRSRSDLSIQVLELIAQSQAMIQQSKDTEMVKTYCKLISKLLQEILGTKIPFADDYCNSIDDNASFPGLPGMDKSKENIYNKILDALKYIKIPIME